METVKIIALSLLAACTYGVVQDQVTVRVCIEYFTIGHPPVFATQSLTLLALGWGIITTWWVGLPLGIALVCSARIGHRAKLGARDLLPMIVKLLVVMGGIAFLAGVAGYLAARQGWVWLNEPLASRIPPNRHALFLVDLWAHLAAYASGIIGGLTLCMLVILRRRKLPASQPTS